ncbi:MAG: hypothetical protein IJ880_00355 [Bacilli bacterium]|nr:hypothetical protein [Bacilli bacterium]
MNFEEFKTKELEALKKEFGVIKKVKIGGIDFVYRLITRKDSKEIDDIIEKEYGDTKQEIIEVPQEDGSILRKSTLSQETLQTKILNRIEDELLKKVVLFPKDLNVDNMSTAIRTELLKCLSEEKVEVEEPELL